MTSGRFFMRSGLVGKFWLLFKIGTWNVESIYRVGIGWLIFVKQPLFWGPACRFCEISCFFL